MQSTSCKMLGWVNPKLESRLQGEILTTLDSDCRRYNPNRENKDHGIWSHHFMINRWKNSENSGRLYFSWAPKSLQMVTAAMKLKDSCSLEESYDQPRQHIKKQRHCFANKGPSSQGYGLSSSHVWM